MDISSLPSFVLGFHGCDLELQQSVLRGEKQLLPSHNSYDWLGTGIYFWENDPHRALDFASESQKRGNSSIKKPAVLGAVLDLKNCLNLFERDSLSLLKEAYLSLRQASKELPKNSNNKLLHNLDCAVINYLHQMIKSTEEFHALDSIRSPFLEGDPLYENTIFQEKNHIQICICNSECIKGYFLPKL